MKIKLLIICLLSCLMSKAQDIKQQINSIKKDKEYMNAEATDESRDEAFDIALGELVTEASGHFSVALSLDAVKNIVKTLEVKRGESIRVFVYAQIRDLQNLSTSHSEAVKPQNDNKPNTEKPNEPRQQEPQERKTPVQVVPTSPILENRSATLPHNRLKSVTSVFSRMNTLTEVKSLLRQYKSEGKITEYNAVKSMNVAPDACIIIFRGEDIVAILQQENQGERINYNTNSNDSLKNYSGCQAIWYK